MSSTHEPRMLPDTEPQVAAGKVAWHITRAGLTWRDDLDANPDTSSVSGGCKSRAEGASC
jgi:hypothetical protein